MKRNRHLVRAALSASTAGLMRGLDALVLSALLAILVALGLPLELRPIGPPSAGFFAVSTALAGPFDLEEDEDDGRSSDQVTLGGLVDLRLVRTSDRRSWLDAAADSGAGWNKYRYGGRDTDRDGLGDIPATEFALPQISLVLDAPVFDGTVAHLQLNLHADLAGDHGSAGLFEGFTTSQGSLGRQALRLRIGAFVPPLSLEHPGPAWSTRYTLTPSAIGSWAGEDLRGIGAELAWKRPIGERHEAGATAGIFSGNDQAGWVLLERGWALHDYQPDVHFSYDLQTERQRNAVNRPFRELDGRPGYYALADLKLAGELVSVRGGIWDNRADQGVRIDGPTPYLYHCRFSHAGLRVSYRRWDLLGQVVDGKAENWGVAEDPLWRKSYRAWYGMAGWETGRLRLALRYDAFRVDRLDDGRAVTAAATWRVGMRHAISAEYSGYEADHTRARFPEVGAISDGLFSVNVRTQLGAR